MTENGVRDLIIIGGGPAGYTAALYAARANLEPVVIEGFQWGGQLMITSDVENYPGYAEGVLGPEMMKDFRRQAERFGAEFVSDDVTRVDFSEQPFGIWVGDEEYRSEAVIIATGADARKLGLRVRGRAARSRRLLLRGLRRGVLPRAGMIIVVGGGDSAMEEATFLTKFADEGDASSTGATSSGPRRSWRTVPARTTRSSSSPTRSSRRWSARLASRA